MCFSGLTEFQIESIFGDWIHIFLNTLVWIEKHKVTFLNVISLVRNNCKSHQLIDFNLFNMKKSFRVADKTPKYNC